MSTLKEDLLAKIGELAVDFCSRNPETNVHIVRTILSLKKQGVTDEEILYPFEDLHQQYQAKVTKESQDEEEDG